MFTLVILIVFRASSFIHAFLCLVLCWGKIFNRCICGIRLLTMHVEVYRWFDLNNYAIWSEQGINQSTPRMHLYWSLIGVACYRRSQPGSLDAKLNFNFPKTHRLRAVNTWLRHRNTFGSLPKVHRYIIIVKLLRWTMQTFNENSEQVAINLFSTDLHFDSYRCFPNLKNHFCLRHDMWMRYITSFWMRYITSF